MNVSVGSRCPELAQAHSSVALAWHEARGSTPFGVTVSQDAYCQDQIGELIRSFSWRHADAGIPHASHPIVSYTSETHCLFADEEPVCCHERTTTDATPEILTSSRLVWPCSPLIFDPGTKAEGICNLRATGGAPIICKLTWLVLGKDPAACSCRAEQFIAR